MQTEVRLDGWCEDGLGQQRDDGGGSVTLRIDGWIIEFNAAISA